MSDNSGSLKTTGKQQAYFSLVSEEKTKDLADYIKCKVPGSLPQTMWSTMINQLLT